MQERVRATFFAEEGLPTWALVHYLQQTEINYIKLVTLERIATLVQGGLDPDALVVAGESAELYQREGLRLEPSREHLFLARKEESAQKFWNVVSRHARPVVFVRETDSYRPLYELRGTNALIIRNLSINSPAKVTLEGAGTALADIYYAGEREERARIQWANEQQAQVGVNLQELARASQIINDPATPPGIREYMQEIVRQTLARQTRLNTELEIRAPSVNARV
ncbi:hypothetical protein HCX48_08130 [Rhodocyclus tenuis]|uniref:Uncharacterized protein n=2 Tax=Rhodocyclus TaxID=1064 RepID=A0A6L5JVR7_RHOTE|nr:hypothetical protein [Rhodocyclus gracilis]MQY51339.1 hypothetical protein [Rhodocyclus gracilis]NJA89186.1 hypothetical protein [Rhodocyclus gracilis]